MQAIKAPFFLPKSRPSTPTSPAFAPSRPDSGVYMDAPSSRPSSPANTPASRSGALGRLHLASKGNMFRRPTTPSPPSPVKDVAPAISGVGSAYLERLGLRLGEAVSKALANQPGSPSGLSSTPSTADHPLLKGRKPIPAGRGLALGHLIMVELQAANDNPNLHRAIVRLLHKPLSVLLANLSSQLFPLLPHLPTSNSTATPTSLAIQVHALSLAVFAAELLQAFDELSLGYGDVAGDGARTVRGDGLKPVREGFESAVRHTLTPLFGAVKVDIVPVIEAYEQVPETSAIDFSHPSTSSLSKATDDITRKLTRYTTSTAGPVSQAILANFLIGLVWKGLVALSSRTLPLPLPPSPHRLEKLENRSLKSRSSRLTQTRSRSRSRTTPPQTPPARLISLIPVRPHFSSRPSSPSRAARTPIQALRADTRSLSDFFNALPKPPLGSLAREAVEEAFDAWVAFVSLLDFLCDKSDFLGCDVLSEEFEDQLKERADRLPTLIVLPLLLQLFPPSGITPSSTPLTIPNLLGLSTKEYRDACLSGFGKADECASVVENSVMDALVRLQANEVSRWLWF